MQHSYLLLMSCEEAYLDTLTPVNFSSALKGTYGELRNTFREVHILETREERTRMQ